jgi:GTP-binding protein
VLVHVLDGATENPLASYEQVRRELELFDPELAAKPEVVAVNKMDLPDARDRWPSLGLELKERGTTALAISAVSGVGVVDLVREVRRLLESLPVPAVVAVLPEIQPTAVDEEDAAVRIFRRGDAWVVRAPWLEKLARRTAWNLPEAVERFHRILQARGVTATLEEVGVQLGDTVIIGEAELEWGQ